MKRILAWVAGALGIAALVKYRRRRPELPPAPADPAGELKRRLEEARGAADDRDEFDAAEGQPVDEIEPARSIAERRQAVHDKAREALGQMKPGEMREPDGE